MASGPDSQAVRINEGPLYICIVLVVGGTHDFIPPDVKGTSHCSKCQNVSLIYVHALQQKPWNHS